jgi:hypothetical protein
METGEWRVGWIFFDFFALQTNFRENREAAMPIHHLNKMESGNSKI